jgi:SAM-dependent methyltransferase
MQTRDRQAAGYLLHAKHRVQAFRVGQFLARHPGPGHVLDLGCGPGPTTKMLLAAGYRVSAIDFSMESLKINAAQCGDGPVTFVQTDLNMVDLEPESADGLMMSDFLQHLGNHEAQRAFLHKGFRALRHGGWFYLTFFNTNIKHRWRGDIVGAFAGGTMPYRRLTKSIVREMLPPEIHVRRAQPMNIANGLTADRLLCSLPFASTLSRMMLMTGYKR